MMVEDEFSEKGWHWWLSRVVIPVVIPLVVALVGAYMLWLVNQDSENGSAVSTSSDRPACAEQVDSLKSGWGPDRPTVGPSQFSPQPSFNVERDNPNYGDERNFLIVKEASFAGAGGWTDALDVVPDNEYLLRAYIHNGAADTEENVARDTNVRFELPTCAGTAIALQGVITSPAAYPQMIWDTAILTARETLRVELVPGSAQQFNNRFPDGVSLPDRVATSGATVGSATADGDVRGDYRNSVIVSARVRTVSE